MQLQKKIKIIWNPTIIDPVIFNSENQELTLTKLRLFDEKIYSLRRSMWGSSMMDSTRYAMSALMRENLRDSTWDSAWDKMKDSMRTSMRITVNESMNEEMRNEMWYSIWESMRHSIRASIDDQMWASICVNLSKDEYESLFEKEEILKALPYDQVKELCDLYHWFTRQGVFIHRSFDDGDYILTSWKNPRHIQKLNILLGVK